MNKMMLPACLLIIVLYIGNVECNLVHKRGSLETLLQYGSAQSPQVFLLEINDNEELMQTMLNTSESNIITSHQISTQKISDNKYNISATLFFDFLPGEANYTITVSTRTMKGDSKLYTLKQSHSVYGMVFFDTMNGKIQTISGDFGVGFNLTSFVGLETDPFRVKSLVHIPNEIDLEPTVEVIGQKNESNILEEDDVIVDEEGLLVMPQPFRTGSAMVIIKSDNLKKDGKSFETAIAITIPDTPVPPAVVDQKGVQRVNIGPNGTIDVMLDMFNVRTDSNLTLLLGDWELPAIFEESVTGKDEQKILFRGAANPGKYGIQVRIESATGREDVISLYDTFLLVGREGEKEKSGLSVVGILLIVFGSITTVVVALILRIIWVNHRSEAQEREMRERCVCPSCEEKDVVHIVRDVYGRGSEQV